MRGKHIKENLGGLPRWNIPAYAGKTTAAVTRVLANAEHPRVCGENWDFDEEE